MILDVSVWLKEKNVLGSGTFDTSAILDNFIAIHVGLNKDNILAIRVASFYLILQNENTKGENICLLLALQIYTKF